jgi:hypothetical protein
MSLSAEDRRANLEFALTHLITLLEGEWARNICLKGDDRQADYPEILTTTWKELAARGYIEDKGFWFRLTGRGWVHAMTLLGKKDDPAFQEQYGKLAGCLKGVVKDRTEDKIVALHDVASSTGLPAGLISNMIESDVFRWFCNSKGASWVGSGGYMIKVPLDFGLEML